jgi:hypothetical protein
MTGGADDDSDQEKRQESEKTDADIRRKKHVEDRRGGGEVHQGDCDLDQRVTHRRQFEVPAEKRKAAPAGRQPNEQGRTGGKDGQADKPRHGRRQFENTRNVYRFGRECEAEHHRHADPDSERGDGDDARRVRGLQADTGINSEPDASAGNEVEANDIGDGIADGAGKCGDTDRHLRHVQGARGDDVVGGHGDVTEHGVGNSQSDQVRRRAARGGENIAQMHMGRDFVNDGERDSDEEDREQRCQVRRKRPPQGPAGAASAFPGLIDLRGHGANIQPVRCADAV